MWYSFSAEILDKRRFFRPHNSQPEDLKLNKSSLQYLLYLPLWVQFILQMYFSCLCFWFYCFILYFYAPPCTSQQSLR